MVQLHVERTIAAPASRVFDWLAEPANFTSSVASWIGFTAGYVGGPGPEIGAVREVNWLGNTWFREEITAYDRPRSYSYLVTRAFPSLDHLGATMTFTDLADGTHVDWVSTFTYPLRTGGKAMDAIGSRLVRRSFLSILARCADALER
ncbi:SRPBCC family protein [Mycolicibacterium fortuitum]|uniref:SRPBCC family protein n=2 Tax=Mycolicibacterium fortuitum TaxID=1766 RepID=A0AAE4V8P1_MYCFO|nr:SRPBCC family protein [Mycolicibacterium fortuitum]MCV7138847.1 SRPBCC family protein [Mycolicibacterium fortuitum]MDV7189289.1 SRPBCC family protein [Mycolicibacterium fortuitum]MDV7202674.1 SRPBCC family protein [Mycolicibacterium fortuitum]MDV7224522.1 SRPBCC family protein [Mycolicibacterium fortuitum]MDV7256480.1 SRPBCC family protein [Mycolicibacterium fortuitum]